MSHMSALRAPAPGAMLPFVEAVVGRWVGEGRGEYSPGVPPFKFVEELIFARTCRAHVLECAAGLGTYPMWCGSSSRIRRACGR